MPIWLIAMKAVRLQLKFKVYSKMFISTSVTVSDN